MVRTIGWRRVKAHSSSFDEWNQGRIMRFFSLHPFSVHLVITNLKGELAEKTPRIRSSLQKSE